MFEFKTVEIVSIMHPVYNYNMWEGTPVVRECSSSRGVKIFFKKLLVEGLVSLDIKSFISF